MSDADTFTVGWQQKNLRSENKSELKLANKSWIHCVSKQYMNQWLSGADVKITDVCVDEHSRMMALDGEVYEPMPFKSLQSQ